MQCFVERITPQKAEEYLKRNMVNRNITTKRVEQYARDMKNGEWQLNGEGIVFDEDGVLKNGQHRLSAIIKAGIPIDMLIIRGIPRDANLQDRGKIRRAYDAMIIDGVDSDLANNRSVAIARLHMRMINKNTTLSDAEIKNFILENQEYLIKIKNLANNTGSRKSKGINVRSALICLPCIYALNAGEKEEDIAKFLKVLRSGIPDSLNQNAALVCRNDILSNVITTGGSWAAREKSILKIEKAIFDFCRHYQRLKSYNSWDKQVYPHVLTKESEEAIA